MPDVDNESIGREQFRRIRQKFEVEGRRAKNENLSGSFVSDNRVIERQFHSLNQNSNNSNANEDKSVNANDRVELPAETAKRRSAKSSGGRIKFAEAPPEVHSVSLSREDNGRISSAELSSSISSPPSRISDGSANEWRDGSRTSSYVPSLGETERMILDEMATETIRNGAGRNRDGVTDPEESSRDNSRLDGYDRHKVLDAFLQQEIDTYAETTSDDFQDSNENDMKPTSTSSPAISKSKQPDHVKSAMAPSPALFVKTENQRWPFEGARTEASLIRNGAPLPPISRKKAPPVPPIENHSPIASSSALFQKTSPPEAWPFDRQIPKPETPEGSSRAKLVIDDENQEASPLERGAVDLSARAYTEINVGKVNEDQLTPETTYLLNVQKWLKGPVQGQRLGFRKHQRQHVRYEDYFPNEADCEYPYAVPTSQLPPDGKRLRKRFEVLRRMPADGGLKPVLRTNTRHLPKPRDQKSPIPPLKTTSQRLTTFSEPDLPRPPQRRTTSTSGGRHDMRRPTHAQPKKTFKLNRNCEPETSTSDQSVDVPKHEESKENHRHNMDVDENSNHGQRRRDNDHRCNSNNSNTFEASNETSDINKPREKCVFTGSYGDQQDPSGGGGLQGANTNRNFADQAVQRVFESPPTDALARQQNRRIELLRRYAELMANNKSKLRLRPAKGNETFRFTSTFLTPPARDYRSAGQLQFDQYLRDWQERLHNRYLSASLAQQLQLQQTRNTLNHQGQSLSKKGASDLQISRRRTVTLELADAENDHDVKTMAKMKSIGDSRSRNPLHNVESLQSRLERVLPEKPQSFQRAETMGEKQKRDHFFGVPIFGGHSEEKTKKSQLKKLKGKLTAGVEKWRNRKKKADPAPESRTKPKSISSQNEPAGAKIHNVTEEPMAIRSRTMETEKPMAKENVLLDKCKNHKEIKKSMTDVKQELQRNIAAMEKTIASLARGTKNLRTTKTDDEHGQRKAVGKNKKSLVKVDRKESLEDTSAKTVTFAFDQKLVSETKAAKESESEITDEDLADKIEWSKDMNNLTSSLIVCDGSTNSLRSKSPISGKYEESGKGELRQNNWNECEEEKQIIRESSRILRPTTCHELELSSQSENEASNFTQDSSTNFASDQQTDSTNSKCNKPPGTEHSRPPSRSQSPVKSMPPQIQTIPSNHTRPSQPQTIPTIQPYSELDTQPDSNSCRQPSSRPSSQQRSRPSSQPRSRPSSQQQSRPSSQQRSRPSSQQRSRPSSQQRSRPSSQQQSRPSSQQQSRPSSQQQSKPSSQQQSNPSSQQQSKPSSQQQSRQPSQQRSRRLSQPSGRQLSQPQYRQRSLPPGRPHSRPPSQLSKQRSGPTRQPQSRPEIADGDCFEDPHAGHHHEKLHSGFASKNECSKTIRKTTNSGRRVFNGQDDVAGYQLPKGCPKVAPTMKSIHFAGRPPSNSVSGFPSIPTPVMSPTRRSFDREAKSLNAIEAAEEIRHDINGEQSNVSFTEKDNALKMASTSIDFHELTAQLKQQKKQVVGVHVSDELILRTEETPSGGKSLFKVISSFLFGGSGDAGGIWQDVISVFWSQKPQTATCDKSTPAAPLDQWNVNQSAETNLYSPLNGFRDAIWFGSTAGRPTTEISGQFIDCENPTRTTLEKMTSSDLFRNVPSPTRRPHTAPAGKSSKRRTVPETLRPSQSALVNKNINRDDNTLFFDAAESVGGWSEVSECTLIDSASGDKIGIRGRRVSRLDKNAINDDDSGNHLDAINARGFRLIQKPSSVSPREKMTREKKVEECRQFATEFEKRLDKIIDRRRVPKEELMAVCAFVKTERDKEVAMKAEAMNWRAHETQIWSDPEIEEPHEMTLCELMGESPL